MTKAMTPEPMQELRETKSGEKQVVVMMELYTYRYVWPLRRLYVDGLWGCGSRRLDSGDARFRAGKLVIRHDVWAYAYCTSKKPVCPTSIVCCPTSVLNSIFHYHPTLVSFISSVLDEFFYSDTAHFWTTQKMNSKQHPTHWPTISFKWMYLQKEKSLTQWGT